MSSHKYLAWFISYETPSTLNHLFTNHPDLIEKFFSENIYILNYKLLNFYNHKRVLLMKGSILSLLSNKYFQITITKYVY